MTKIEPYSLYWADVPFEEGNDSKLRPVIIIDNQAFVVSCLAVTSNTSRPEDYLIKEWKEAGLKYPSSVRLQYAIELSNDAIGKKIGRLQPIDILELQQRL